MNKNIDFFLLQSKLSRMGNGQQMFQIDLKFNVILVKIMKHENKKYNIKNWKLQQLLYVELFFVFENI
jgi:hypothetical protein